MKDHQSNLVGTFLVLEATDHEHYRTGHIAAAVGNCYLIQFDKVEDSEEHLLPPMELYTLPTPSPFANPTAVRCVTSP
jgi:hypothetical protein